MASKKANRTSTRDLLMNINHQGAEALLAATFDFLCKNKISRRSLVTYAQKFQTKNTARKKLQEYREIVRTYEEMGVVMATWFSNPEFLDHSGAPVPLSPGSGRLSLARLLRASGAQVKVETAIALMRQSPSIKIGRDGNLSASMRVFSLPQLEVPRAAFVVERFLGTIQQLSAARKRSGRLILERSCHVSEADLARKIPLLRDIEGRATAFMDSIDGDLEDRRIRKAKRKNVGELGVHVFTWARPVTTGNGRRHESGLPLR